MIFRRLFVSFLVLIVTVTASLGFFAASRLRSSQIAATRRALREESNLVRALILEDLSLGRAADVAGKLKTLSPSAERRITLIATDGRVLIDTMGNPATMDNHRLRPEIVAAAEHGEGDDVRVSDSLHREMMYHAARIVPPGGDPVFLRIAVPLADMEAHLSALTAKLVGTALLALALAAGICFVLVRRHTRPLTELTSVADDLAKGDLQRRARLEEPGEIGHLARSVNTMADALARTIDQVKKDREELRAILTAMGEGVIAIDRRQRVLLANPGASAVFGFPPQGAVSKDLLELIRNEDVLKAATEALTGARPVTFQIEPSRNRRVDVTVRPWPSTGEPEGAIILTQDVTEATRYQELRREFAANVSHEFRTPLTLIKGFVETLQDGAIRDLEKGPAFLETISRHVNQLSNLVADLLDLSALENRSQLPKQERIDLNAVIRGIVELLLPAAAKKGQRLEAQLPASTCFVPGDGTYVERMIQNLVDNAIKYTPEKGAITIRLRAEGGAAVLEVADDGIGIPDEDMPRIFERFYRVDRSRSREMGGTGLGLSIVKHIVQAHGGSVAVESRLGKGTVFRVTLPEAAPDEEDPISSPGR